MHLNHFIITAMNNNFINISEKKFCTARLNCLKALLLTCAFFTTGLTWVQGQVNNTAYFMNRLPQASWLNPAKMQEQRVFIGLPVVSSINLGVGNNFVSFNDVIFKSSVSDSLITFLHPEADRNAFISNLRDANAVNSDLQFSVFALGFRQGSQYFSFGINERFSMRGALPKDLLVVMLKGNEEFAGKEAVFSKLGFGLNYYREYALGYSREINNKWTAGGRVKLLFGKANAFLDKQDLGLYTDPDDYSLRLHSRFTLNASMPLSIEYDEDGDISSIAFRFDDDDFTAGDWILNPENKGLALDLGVTFRPLEALTLSASLVDLGYINWSKDVYNFSMDGELDFKGLDISPIFNKDNDIEVFQNFLDSIADIFAITDTRNAYKRSLGSTLYVGGEYQIKPRLRLGLLSRTGFGTDHVEQAVTLSANWDLTNFFGASASYSMMNNTYANLGAGLYLRGGPFQFFVISDNINAIFAPHKIRFANVWFGMNLVFGSHKKAEPQEQTE